MQAKLQVDQSEELTPRRRQMSLEAEVEIQKRRTYTLQGALNPERKGKLFEHFVVTGLPPWLHVPRSASLSSSNGTPLKNSMGASPLQSRLSSNSSVLSSPPLKFEPQILFCWPPSDTVQKHLVTQFSFPEGLSSNKVKRLVTEVEKNQLVFAPLSKLEESNASFCFLLTAEEGLLYGVCVVQDELLRDPLSFAEENANFPIPNDDVGYIVAPRCYMFLTKFPFFATHFQVLYSMLALERTSRMFKAMAPEEHKTSDVLTLLYNYHSFEVPKSGQQLCIKLEEDDLTFYCPPGDEDEQLCDFCLGAALKLLSLDTILLLISAILQEYQIVVISKHVSIISAIVMSLIPLMRPYVWQGTFIPVLPTSLEECVHSPMPYIIGLTQISSDSLEVLDDVLILDVDRFANETSQFINVPKGLSELPYKDNLEYQLRPLHTQLFRACENDRKKCYLQPYSNEPSEIQIGRAFLATLRLYHKDIHEVIERGISTITNFQLSKPRHLYKLVCAVADDHYNGFLKRFLGTQHWHFYYEKVHPLQSRHSGAFSNDFLSLSDLNIPTNVTSDTENPSIPKTNDSTSSNDPVNGASENSSQTQTNGPIVESSLHVNNQLHTQEKSEMVAQLTSAFDVDDEF